MYKNLKKEIDRLKISHRDIFDNSMSDYYTDIKSFKRRLNGNLKFKEEDIEDIYKYLKKRGYKSSKSKKEDIDYLFKYERKTAVLKLSPCSDLIRKRMMELNLSNNDVVEQFDDFGYHISITTLNNWKNEGVCPKDIYAESLSKVLKTPIAIIKEAMVMQSTGRDNLVLEIVKNLRDCRNELCLYCGKYKKEYLGACNNCRWEH